MDAQHSIIQEDFKAQLRTQISLKAETLKDIEAKRFVVQAELDRIKQEIKELNLKHKDKIVEVASFEESSFHCSDKEVASGGGGDGTNTSLQLNKSQ